MTTFPAASATPLNPTATGPAIARSRSVPQGTVLIHLGTVAGLTPLVSLRTAQVGRVNYPLLNFTVMYCTASGTQDSLFLAVPLSNGGNANFPYLLRYALEIARVHLCKQERQAGAPRARMVQSC